MMVLHLGKNIVINTKYIIGIFDIEKTSVKPDINNFLKEYTKKSQVINVSYDMPKTFILYKKADIEKIFILSISAKTLTKRIEMGEKIERKY